jgi:predicted nucleic acid-binding Zn finger protein
MLVVILLGISRQVIVVESAFHSGVDRIALVWIGGHHDRHVRQLEQIATEISRFGRMSKHYKQTKKNIFEKKSFLSLFISGSYHQFGFVAIKRHTWNGNETKYLRIVLFSTYL